MTSSEISANKLKGAHLALSDNVSNTAKAGYKTLHTKQDQNLPETTSKSLTTRKISKIADIKDANDFKSWIANESLLVSAESEKVIKPINIIKAKIKAVAPIIAVGLVLGALSIIFGTASFGILVTAIFYLVSIGIIFGTGVFAYRAANDIKIEEKAIAKMTPMLLQEAIKELFNNDQFNDITSDDYRELAKAVSASFKEANVIGIELASKLVTALSKVNASDTQSNILPTITSESTKFIKLVFERLEFHLESKEVAKKLAIAKKELFKQGNDSFKKSESLNKFTADLYKLVENHNKKAKGKTNLIMIKKHEMENAIQQGIDNYFFGVESNI